MSIFEIVLCLPLIGFVLLLLLPKGNPQLLRGAALAISGIVFLASLALLPAVLANAGSFSFETDLSWITEPNIRYHVGVDGVSLWLILLTTFLTPIAISISGKSLERGPQLFFALMLLLEFGLIGVFAALDLFLFYVFWEVALVPIFFVVGIWGGARRAYAAVKFFVYTMAGSVLMLASIIFLYNKSGTFDYVAILDMLQSGSLVLLPVEQTLLFLGFFAAFAIKVALFPVHTWLPDAYNEAPIAGSVMLAAVLTKMGTYGILRFCLPLFPNAARDNADWIAGLAIIGILYGALVALVQTNMKKLVAYSSISHLGFILLGLFSFNQIALDGAVYMMVAHGISTGALFILVGYLAERRGSLDIADYGGVATPAPWLATLFMVTTLGSIGLPTLSNFVGEFLILQGAAIAHFEWAVFAAFGVVLSACYMLWFYQRTFFGRAPNTDPPRSTALPDLSRSEWMAVAPLMVAIVWLGVGAQTFLPSISASNKRTLLTTQSNLEQEVRMAPLPKALQLNAIQSQANPEAASAR